MTALDAYGLITSARPLDERLADVLHAVIKRYGPDARLDDDLVVQVRQYGEPPCLIRGFLGPSLID